MATPLFSIAVQPVNLLALTNEDSIPLYFKLYELNDNGDNWTEITIAALSPLEPDLSLPADGVFTMILADNLYKIFISDAPVVVTDPVDDPGYYVLADQNIKLCKRTLLQRYLCGVEPKCDPVADKRILDKMMRFDVLEKGLYFIYSKWIQYQAYTMLIVPLNQELLSMRSYLDQLLDMCDCKVKGCTQCSGNSYNKKTWSTKYSNQDCGCN